MDVEVNWESDDDTCSSREDADSHCISEWGVGKASIQREVEEGLSLPPSSDDSPDRPPGEQELPAKLHWEDKASHGLCHQWSDSATGDIFITPSTNFGPQCEDEDSALHSAEHAKGSWGKISESCDDFTIAGSLDEEDLVPTPGVVPSHHCKECGEMPHSYGRTLGQQKDHVAERSYRCPLCSKEFFHTANFRVHQLIHVSDRPYRCPECDKGFVHKVDLWRHLRNVHRIEHSKRLEALPAASFVHQNQSSGGVAPPICLQEPETEQPKPYLCPICDKAFRTAYLLLKHKVIHQEDKPYKCPECGKAFIELMRLKRHQKIHARERPFYCEECGGTVTRLTAPHRHQRIHTGEKP
ncbi:hypothetical protein EYD10_12111 [Varanus komodoensis]|uniref:C2H2-type domain-containing protein n=1 Tax=Varanus komodoensis TaxID=61221 RepID=A0A8D2IZG7_VARKO|nr:zinc finger protein 227-like [Varanus komodoensis]XP_044295124.1 zinc finger protein 227-like [Varanus komodoensis]XP_044295126.1 zinc finger protein 227-like [Varanus komodoensis]XP_044295127.1 zinc finger protein 227-like [Varanus komodoensis]XP_044295128.1 zinc finger protein 227-like [Varanus komodoensis]XP_044295129.1 zinc finger protein 227-like [Varanus komodoensis]XP_044295130.1 zinc finger protein 227-like [Varanus komodoensis]XP_044295131.1 zinc finger protein 227-like [Varanus 